MRSDRRRWLVAVMAGLVTVAGGMAAADAQVAEQVAEASGGTPSAVTAAAIAAAPKNVLAEIASLTYQPRERVEGSLRLAGSLTLQQAAALWSQGFTGIHPAVACAIESGGSNAGWKAFVEGRADVALLSRPVEDAERAAWEKQSGRRLVVVAVAFDQLVWIVNAANPVTALPWSPATGILRAEGDAAASTVATRWDRLNGDAGWKDTEIHVHGRDLASGTRWHLDRLLTGSSSYHLDVKEHHTEAELAEAVAADRGGLGLVSQRHGHWPGVKPLPLVIPGGAAPLVDAVVGSERTPDSRPLFVACAAPKEGPPADVVREFLAYVLSYSGQLDAAKDGFLPLLRGELHAQRELVEGQAAR
jgi:ABC-type phosphate transport system substrate-binding protein